jgi:hypothetical protein
VIPAGARCGLHAEVAAVDVCQRCGRFLCGDCVELAADEVYCADCAPKVNQPASLLAKAGLIIAWVAWGAFATFAFGLRAPLFFVLLVVVPAPTALAALACAVVEWRRLKAGTSARRGRPWVLGTFAVAAPLVLLMGALYAYGLNALLSR